MVILGFRFGKAHENDVSVTKSLELLRA